MKKHFFLLSLFLSLTLGIGQMWGTEASVTISPSQALNDGGVSPITVQCAKGDGTSNPAISSGQLRLYQAASGKTTGNTITFISTYHITSIVFTFANNMTASNGSFSEGNYNSETSTWSGSTDALRLTVTGTSSSTRIYITNMVVTYETGGGTLTCATPTFSPAAGSYEGTQNVTITSTTGATIYYTTDGSNPTTSGTKQTYSSPIAVSADMTIKAYATLANYDDSEVATAAYTITEGPDVTLNLIDGNWGFPTSNTTEDGTYTNSVSGYSVTCHAPTNYKVSGSDYFFIGKSGAYILLPTFTSPIEKIVVSGNSGGAADVAWNIYQGETAVSTAASGCKNDAYTFEIAAANQKANVAHAIKVTNAKNLQIKVIKIYFGAAPDVATPTISGEQNFTTSTTVTLGCTTDDAYIYYTTDGTTPSSSSTLYSDPFTLNSTATVKAIAIKGGTSSIVAEMSFTKIVPLTTMDAIFEKATQVSSTATDVYITFNNWVVTGVKGSNAYVTDGTKGLIIYQSSHGFVVGNKLSGTVACKVQLYKGSSEITSLTKTTTGLTVTTGGTVTPVELDASGIAALTGVNTGSVIKISGACTTSNDNYYIAGVQLYNTLFTYENPPTAGKNYNCTGVYVQYNSTKEILPRSAADIEEIAEEGAPEAPTFSPAAGTYTSVQSVEISSATQGATIYYTTDGTTPTSASTEYSSAISVGENTTIKAIAIKNSLESTVATAAYTIIDENVKKLWNLAIDETSTANEDELTWSATYVDMSYSKETSTTNANNYYPGTTGQSYTSTRFYKNGVLTITPAEGKQITTVMFKATTSGYASALASIAWENASAAVNSADETIVDVTAIGQGAISATIGATCGFTQVLVNYKDIDASVPANPTFSPAAGSYTSAQNVEISCATQGATIYYTTDGTTPTSASTPYSSAISVSESMTIKAIAIKESKSSSVVSAAYTINIDSRSIATGSSFAEVSGNLSPAVIAYAAYKGDGTTDPAINNSNIRIYKPASGKSTGGYLTLTAVSGCTIDQVKITFAGNATAAYCINDAALPTTQYIHDETELLTPAELNAQSVSIVNLKNGSIDVKEIVVYYTGEAVTLQSLAISGTASVLEYNEGQNFNPAGLVVTGTYSDGSHAVISEGITWAYDPSPLTKGTTSVSITATVSEITSSAFVVNGLTVGAAGTTYRKVTATEDITDGEYLIVYETENVAFNGNLTTLDAAQNTVSVVISDNVIAGSTEIDAAVFTIDVANGTLRAHMGDYIGVTSYGNGLKQNADPETYPAHSFSIDGDGNAVISLNNNWTAAMALNYNKGASDKRFRYYKSASQQPIQLYKKDAQPVTKYTVTYAAGGGSGDAPAPVEYEEGETFTVAEADLFTAPEGKEFDGWLCDIDQVKYAADAEYTMTAANTTFTAQWKDAAPIDPEPIYTVVRSGLEIGRYYTICLPQEITAVRGAIFWSMAKRNSEGTLAYLEEVVDQFGAGKPYIYLATADKLEVAYGTDEADAPVANGALRGTFAEMNQDAIDGISAANENSLIYMLVSNQLRQIVGRTGNKIAANRAYVVYKALTTGEPNPAPGRRVATMSMQENVATGIDAMNADGTDAMKVIVNGQLFILRDGKTFDVTGREIIRK